ncbi:hypothetical protein L6452_10261 [Arctium lappa]|uniref:Uncharacterized protein n=1 Tax=Arctium lappa TaxID=4217 RepID=A0ACB9DMK0_ARCLA|nr:hypothetical protein L6452_10261 [Arctium lappa]
MARTYQRQNSHVRSISLPCGPVCVKDEYNKLMGQVGPSSPTAETLMEEDAIDQTPSSSSSRCGLPFMLTSLVFIFMAIAVGMSKYSEDGFWLTAKKRMFMYR